MRRTSQPEAWVVYRTVLRGTETAVNAVCEQGEWDAMEAARPGQQILVRGGITSEGEAERLARGKSGDPLPRTSSAKSAAGTPPPTAETPLDDDPGTDPAQ